MPTKTPAIGLSPTSLTFNATAGGPNPASQNVAVSNVGQSGSTLNWTQTDNAAWLTVTPASGTNAGTLACSVSVAGLAAGSYSGTITVSASGASNTPQTVAVSLGVTAPAFSGGVTVAGTGGASIAGKKAASRTVTISGTGSAVGSGKSGRHNAVTVNGVSSLSITGTGSTGPVSFSGAVTVAGAGGTAVAGRKASIGTVALIGSGGLTASARTARRAASSLNGTSRLAIGGGSQTASGYTPPTFTLGPEHGWLGATMIDWLNRLAQAIVDSGGYSAQTWRNDKTIAAPAAIISHLNQMSTALANPTSHYTIKGFTNDKYEGWLGPDATAKLNAMEAEISRLRP